MSRLAGCASAFNFDGKAPSEVWCTTDGACVSSHCSDGVCCDSVCSDTCKSCNLSGKAGTCTLVPLGQTDTNATQTCTGAQVCDGKGACLTAKGQICSKGTDCLSNLCVDYVCCDNTCTGTCMSCDVSASKGTCTFTPLGQQDTNASTTCTNPYACDGKGGCKTAKGKSCSSGSTCASGHCADGVCCDTSCDDACKTCSLSSYLGTCSNVPKGSQDLSAKTPCTGNNVCDGAGFCGKDDGQTCSAAKECASGYCADGYCCDAKCNASCLACDLNVSTTIKPGKCNYVLAGKQDLIADTPCSGTQVCDGKGKCGKANGQTCTKDGECGSGYCTDGYCCKERCDKACLTCNTKGKEGSCEYVVALLPDLNAKSPCTGKLVCDGYGECKKDVSEPCNMAAQCATGYCTDSVCCLSACTETCMTCNLSESTKGTCKPHAKDIDPDNDCQGAHADCGGKCNGKGKCDYPGAGTLCEKTKSCMACDGTGKCNSVPLDDTNCGVIDCDKLDTSCRDYHDLTAGRCESLGVCKEANKPASCSKYTEVQCDAGLPDVGVPDVGNADVGKVEAGKKDQGGKAPGDEDDGGCGCGVAGGPCDFGWGLMLILLLFVPFRTIPILIRAICL